MVDNDGYRLVTYKLVFYCEIGWTDGCGMGRWEKTKLSLPFRTNEGAEAKKKEWIEEGILEIMSWGEYRPTFPYGIFRIRRSEELIQNET